MVLSFSSKSYISRYMYYKFKKVETNEAEEFSMGRKIMYPCIAQPLIKKFCNKMFNTISLIISHEH